MPSALGSWVGSAAAAAVAVAVGGCDDAFWESHAVLRHISFGPEPFDGAFCCIFLCILFLRE